MIINILTFYYSNALFYPVLVCAVYFDVYWRVSKAAH